MELRPTDLGDAYQSALVLRRSRGRLTDSVGAARRLGRTERWVRPLNLSENVQQTTLPATVKRTNLFRFGLSPFFLLTGAAELAAPLTVEAHLLLLGMSAAAAFLFGEVLPSAMVRTLYTSPLSEAEVRAVRTASIEAETAVAQKQSTTQSGWLTSALEKLLPSQKKPAENAATLESDYFDLILAVLRLPNPDASVAADLRGTLRQIGEAVAAVRRSEIEEDRADSADLIGDAELLAARARGEGDRLVAASLLRQAQAKVAQAKVVEKNVLLRRRTRALGAELRAQIAAAQSSLRNLSSQGVMNAESAGSFRSIADSVRTLATEANSVVAAHDELAAALNGSSPRRNAPNADLRPAEEVRARPTVTPAPVEIQTLQNRRGG